MIMYFQYPAKNQTIRLLNFVKRFKLIPSKYMRWAMNCN